MPSSNSIKAIYFGDALGDIEDEARDIEKLLKFKGVNIHVTPTDLPPFENMYNILFFDWGGMSMGNSMLERFCDLIVEEAEEHPQRVYVMCSSMTEYAMKDALEYCTEKPANVFLDLRSEYTIQALRELIDEN